MIPLKCDRCERALEAPDELAGKKIQCPHCGDVNVVPVIMAASSPAVPHAPPTPHDRAAAAGLPPDAGPEERVMLVRPAMLRAKPVLFLLHVAAIGAGIAGLVYFGSVRPQTELMWASGALIGVACLSLLVWKILTLAAGLEITNKRTVEHRGLLSRRTSEVVHDNIRNVQITQSFWDRIWGVGEIGISSSGQDGIEIMMKDIRNPDRVRRTIDAYRPL